MRQRSEARQNAKLKPFHYGDAQAEIERESIRRRPVIVITMEGGRVIGTKEIAPLHFLVCDESPWIEARRRLMERHRRGRETIDLKG